MSLTVGNRVRITERRDDTRPPTTKAAVAAAAFVSERAQEGQIKENAPNNFHIKKPVNKLKPIERKAVYFCLVQVKKEGVKVE